MKEKKKELSDADKWRIHQAEELLKELGWIKVEGGWKPPTEDKEEYLKIVANLTNNKKEEN